ncbi:MAG: hypothetical protein ACXV3D_08385, partial [Halobacteriota archaeon]
TRLKNGAVGSVSHKSADRKATPCHQLQKTGRRLCPPCGGYRNIVQVLIVLRQISQYKSTAPETNKRIVRETVVALFSRV